MPRSVRSMVKTVVRSVFEQADEATIVVAISIEDAGLCRKGEGGRFVVDHDLTYRGDVPPNTHGGQLAFGQADFAGGMFLVTEPVRQFCGSADARQPSSASLGLVTGNGGSWARQRRSCSGPRTGRPSVGGQLLLARCVSCRHTFHNPRDLSALLGWPRGAGGGERPRRRVVADHCPPSGPPRLAI